MMNDFVSITIFILVILGAGVLLFGLYEVLSTVVSGVLRVLRETMMHKKRVAKPGKKREARSSSSKEW